MTDKKVEATIIRREYNAPIQLVFDAWTDPEHLKHWNFPFQGFVCEYLSANITNGGQSLHKMTMPNGHEMWLLTRYEDIRSPTLIVFRQYNSNAAGEILPNPQMPNWPKEMRTTIELSADGDRTKLALIWEPVDPSPEEIEAFESSRANHSKGWGGGLDQLGLYVEK